MCQEDKDGWQEALKILASGIAVAIVILALARGCQMMAEAELLRTDQEESGK